MKNFRMLATFLIVFGALGIAVRAQETPKKEAAKPAGSPSQALLEQWNDVGRKLIAMAEDFPEDKYDYKPVSSVRSFAERLIHAAHANEIFIAVALGQKAPPDEDPKRDQFKTKGGVVTFVKKSFADGAAAIKIKGDKGLPALVTDPFSHERTRIGDFAYGFVEHSGEIYGQLTVYYRVAGMVPPESRPKSREFWQLV